MTASHIISIADREKIAFEDGEIPQVVRCAYPSPLTAELQDEAASIATKIAGYVGLENGPLCVQAFYREGEGLAVCEAAGRIFGYEHELVTLGSGLSVEELLIDCVTTSRGPRLACWLISPCSPPMPPASISTVTMER